MTNENNKTLAKGRVLRIYNELLEGKCLNTSDLAKEYGVAERSIHRDIDEIQAFLDEEGSDKQLIYNYTDKGYEIPVIREKRFLSQAQAFAVIKMLLEDRGLKKEELNDIIDKLVEACIASDKKISFKNQINDERVEYAEPKHGKNLIDLVWELQKYATAKCVINMDYTKVNGVVVTRKVIPKGIMFSEQYFYMIGFNYEKDKSTGKPLVENFPLVYRVDRIQYVSKTKETFKLEDIHAKSLGYLRQRIQYMHTGDLKRVRFYCKDYVVPVALDRLPTAKVIKENNQNIIEAEVYGSKGITMWLGSQGDAVELIELKNI